MAKQFTFFNCRHSMIRLDAVAGVEKMGDISGGMGTISIYIFGSGTFVLAGSDAVKFLEEWEAYLLGEE